MTAGKAAPDKGAAARAEVNGAGKPKQITWQGIKFDLPKELPGSVLWDFADLGSDGDQQLPALLGLLRKIIGSEQNRLVKTKVEEKGWSIEQTAEALMDEESGLIARALGKYDLTPGESKASQVS